jgi:hypothetical protein
VCSTSHTHTHTYTHMHSDPATAPLCASACVCERVCVCVCRCVYGQLLVCLPYVCVPRRTLMEVMMHPQQQPQHAPEGLLCSVDPSMCPRTAAWHLLLALQGGSPLLAAPGGAGHALTWLASQSPQQCAELAALLSHLPSWTHVLEHLAVQGTDSAYATAPRSDCDCVHDTN